MFTSRMSVVETCWQCGFICRMSLETAPWKRNVFCIRKDSHILLLCCTWSRKKSWFDLLRTFKCKNTKYWLSWINSRMTSCLQYLLHLGHESSGHQHKTCTHARLQAAQLLLRIPLGWANKKFHFKNVHVILNQMVLK